MVTVTVVPSRAVTTLVVVGDTWKRPGINETMLRRPTTQPLTSVPMPITVQPDRLTTTPRPVSQETDGHQSQTTCPKSLVPHKKITYLCRPKKVSMVPVRRTKQKREIDLETKNRRPGRFRKSTTRWKVDWPTSD